MHLIIETQMALQWIMYKQFYEIEMKCVITITLRCNSKTITVCMKSLKQIDVTSVCYVSNRSTFVLINNSHNISLPCISHISCISRANASDECCQPQSCLMLKSMQIRMLEKFYELV